MRMRACDHPKSAEQPTSFLKQFDFCFFYNKNFLRRGQPKSIELEQRNEFDANFLLFRRAVFNYSKKLLRPIDFHAASLPFLHPPPSTLKRIHLNYFHFLIKIFLRPHSASSVCLQYFFDG